MRLSLSTGSLYIYPLRSTFRLVREAGFDGVELVVGPEVLWRGGAAVRRLAHDHGLTIFSLHPPLFPMPGWQDYGPAMQKLVELAQELETPLIVLHPPSAAKWEHPHSQGFLNALDIARHGLAGTRTRVALENPTSPSHGQRLLVEPDALRAFAQAHDLRLVLDTAHAASLSHPLQHTYELFDGRLANVHLSDVAEHSLLPDILGIHAFVKRHQFPGEGQLPLDDLLRRLSADGYQGSVTMELSPVPLQIWWPPAVRRRLRQAVMWVQEALSVPTSRLA
jgi:sugar phosphate isomerase/epimerase